MVNHSLQSQMSKRNVNSRKSEFYAAEVKKQPRQATNMFTFLCFKDCKNDVNRSTMHCLTNLMLQKFVHTQIACFDLEMQSDSYYGYGVTFGRMGKQLTNYILQFL